MADGSSREAAMSTPGISETTADKLSQALPSERFPSTESAPVAAATTPLAVDDDYDTRPFHVDGRRHLHHHSAAAQFTEYGIDVREELRTIEDDENAGDVSISSSRKSTAALEVSNLINGQQQSRGSEVVNVRLGGEDVEKREEDVGERSSSTSRRASSLLDDEEVRSSSTPTVNHFSSDEQLPGRPRKEEDDGVGGNEDLSSSRNYNWNDGSANSWPINNKSVFNENPRGASASASSMSSPLVVATGITTTTTTSATTTSTASSTPSRTCKFNLGHRRTINVIRLPAMAKRCRF